MLKRYWEGYPAVNAKTVKLMVQLSGAGLVLIGLFVIFGFWIDDYRFRSWASKESNADGMALPTAVGFICIGVNFILLAYGQTKH